MTYTITPRTLQGTVPVPGSKSHTIRALLIASMAGGKSVIRNPLDSRDTRSCISACRTLGAEIEERDGSVIVRGTGGIPKPAASRIDVGNSGTTLYLAAGLAALGSSEIEFTGDEQIRRRPIGPLLRALGDLGASARTVSPESGECAPVFIRGPLKGGTTDIECPTSQYLSGLLLCTPLAEGDTRITVPLLHERPYVEMTLRWLSEQGIRVENKDFRSFFIPGGQHYRPFDRPVPADFSSASFFLCAAAVTGSRLTLTGLDMTDSQGDKEVVNILRRMGCRVTETPGTGTEPAALTIEGGTLRGGEFDLNDIPDALPILAVTACFVKGETRLVNVPQARLKETDRITVMAEELTALGASVEELPDGLIIRGRGTLAGTPAGGPPARARDDHRVVMALAIAGTAAENPVIIDDISAAGVTFPGFFGLLEKVSPGR